MKLKIKMGIDILMTALLICLMVYQITGQTLHEWLGAGELWLFIAHNILNIKWYGNLLKGKYRLLRIIQTIINFSVLISMLCLGYSGIVMSRHVICSAFDSWSHGNGKKYAHGGLLLGVCADELPSWNALGDGYGDVWQIIKGQGTSWFVCVGFTVGSRIDCGIWTMLLYSEGYCFLYVFEE